MVGPRLSGRGPWHSRDRSRPDASEPVSLPRRLL